jgi:hypothetical protein
MGCKTPIFGDNKASQAVFHLLLIHKKAQKRYRIPAYVGKPFFMFRHHKRNLGEFWMKRILLFLGICILLALPIFTPRVFAQTAAELETLFYTNAVNYGQAARFVLLAADIADTSPEDAFSYASEKNWLPAKAEMDAAAKLDGISLLLMRAFDMKGGAFYTLMKTPHYAYRELLFQNVIQGRADPGMAVSGDLLLFVVNRALELKEGEL